MQEKDLLKQKKNLAIFNAVYIWAISDIGSPLQCKINGTSDLSNFTLTISIPTKALDMHKYTTMSKLSIKQQYEG